jgi:Predicted phosphohydrolase (DHH superfamily)
MNKFLRNLFKKIKRIFVKKEKYKGLKEHEVLIIAHGDIDGLASASIIKRKFNDTYLITTSPRKIDMVLKDLNIHNKKIFIADLSPNESQISNIAKSLERLKENGCEIVWIDHHSWSKESMNVVSNYAKLIVENTFSATELVYKVLEVEDEISKKLVDIANDADEAKYSLEDTVNIHRALRNKRRSKAIFDLLTEGKFSHEKIIKWSKEAEEDDYRIIEHAKKVKLSYTKNGTKFAVIDLRKKDLPGNMVAKYAIQFHNLDFCIVIYSNRSVSLYRGNRSDIDLIKVARMFNGGGHPYACGCNLKLSFKSKVLSKIFGKRYIPKEIKNLIEKAIEIL